MWESKVLKKGTLYFYRTIFWDSPAPSNLNWAWNFGSYLSCSLFVQILSGMLLSLYYVPGTMEDAFNSIQFIERDVNGGWILRSVHVAGASSFFFFMYCHVGRGLYYGSYKNFKAWSMGVAILALSMLEGFMGYVLPAGQMSFWGATVISNFLTVIPFFGDTLLKYVLGGYSVCDLTLSRFFVAHFLAPFLISLMVLFHLIWGHEKGASNPLGVSTTDWITLSPGYVFKDLAGGFFMESLVLGMFSSYSWLFQDPTNSIMANPMYTPVHIQPEWYFLFAYSILRCVDSKTGGVIMMLLSILVFLLPMVWGQLDEKKNQSMSSSLRFLPMCKAWYWMFVFSFLGLTFLGTQAPEEPFKMVSQVLSVMYYSFFLFFPFIKKVDSEFS
uniref:Cytochrome b n=1 Tax=Hiatella arctica TaxID=120431 RepID=Q06SB2_9BIVA|nr:cytochrome b [Hiatella arctica]